MKKLNKTTIGIIAILVLIIIFTIFDIGTDNNQRIEHDNFETPFIMFDTTTAYKDSVFKLYKEDTTHIDSVENSFKTTTYATYKCLGCHDGITASDKGSFVKGHYNNHPVGIYYNAFQNDELRSPDFTLDGGGTIRDLLENGYVGCTSCHLEHNEDNVAKLVMDNKNSKLCLVCHIK